MRYIFEMRHDRQGALVVGRRWEMKCPLCQVTDLDERLTLTSYRQLGIYYEVSGVVVLPVPDLRRPDLDIPLDRPHSAPLITQNTTKLPAATCTTCNLQLTDSLQPSTYTYNL